MAFIDVIQILDLCKSMNIFFDAIALQRGFFAADSGFSPRKIHRYWFLSDFHPSMNNFSMPTRHQTSQRWHTLHPERVHICNADRSARS
ncbi:hypothetical protein G7048_16310 [Diaphorobacter sp. HDW4B]|uniref:hypothetical protein n=1 Tax=Diaphorobacter sp. HDW4B TaxID=2714925 RepID=UPI00140AD1BC|nr:hypothetical protein [Diaphorobacter sp. HDW4B]QIL71782.1 hypothetical protein G7048_16310 [Diaphorobacter sp. HDW4B]